MTEHDKQLDIRRSYVRLIATYAAVAFVFGGGGLLIRSMVIAGDRDGAVAVFNVILPVASGTIAYWFAARKPTRDK